MSAAPQVRIINEEKMSAFPGKVAGDQKNRWSNDETSTTMASDSLVCSTASICKRYEHNTYS
jgi:hypothetical protein